MTTSEPRWRAGDSLEATEKLMLECAAAGDVLDGSDGLPASGPAALKAEKPRTVRAAVLRHLLTETDWAVDPKGVRLRWLRISGMLDLQAVTVRCPLLLEDCDLVDPRPIALDFATIPLLAMTGCRLAGVSGDTLAVAANLNLRGSVLAGSAELTGARIGGGLICERSVFGGPMVLSGALISGAMMFRGAKIGADTHGDSLVCNGMTLRLSAHLRDFTTSGAVRLTRAEIGGELICRDAHLGANQFGNSIAATGLRVRGSAYLEGGFSTQGAVWLSGANIGGQLRCDSAHIGADVNGNSLICDGIRTGSSVNLNVADGTAFTADGAVLLAGAEVAGSLSCRGAKLGENQDGNSLVADEMKVRVAALLDDGFAASGAVCLSGADIGGQFRCQGSQITGVDREGNSLIGTGIRVGGAAHFDEGFRAAGGIELSGADISGLLSLSTARLGANTERYALVADGMRTSRDVLADNGTFDGGIRLIGAIIGGSLACRGARLGAGRELYTLVAIRLKVAGDLLLDRLISAGAVVVAGADISGRLCCRNTILDGSDADGDAFSANGAKVGGSVLLNELQTNTGAVQLSHSSIGGSLHCGGARLAANKDKISLFAEHANVTGGVQLDKGFTAAGAVSLRGASLAHELRWDPGEAPGGGVNLEGARAQQLTDNWTSPRVMGYWPAGRLRLTGFTYEELGGDHPVTVQQRLAWIRSQHGFAAPGSRRGNQATASLDSSDEATTRGAEHALATVASVFTTQPYKQLANVYRRAGQEDEALTVEIAMRRDLRRYGGLPRPARFLNWLLDVTIRYGFQTSRALAGIVALYVIVFLAFFFAQHQGNLIAASNIQNPTSTRQRCIASLDIPVSTRLATHSTLSSLLSISTSRTSGNPMGITGWDGPGCSAPGQ